MQTSSLSVPAPQSQDQMMGLLLLAAAHFLVMGLVSCYGTYGSTKGTEKLWWVVDAGR